MTNETELTLRLRDPEQRTSAFTELVEAYKEPLYWQIRRMVLIHDDADDVLQNTFLKAWTGIENFRGESKLSTWLFRIAYNETLNFIERRRQATSIDDEGAAAVAATLQSDPYFDGDETELQLQEAVSKLPEKQRLVFNMKYFQELKYEEISQILGTSVGALKTSYHIAVQKITSFFEKID